MTDPHLDMYLADDVVAFYDSERDLQETERVIFDAHIPEGLEVLDIGVGAGRTTRFLADTAKRYVGLDYSEKMVEHCRRIFPEHQFLVQDASRMHEVASESFDRVLFSFNGIDTLPDEEGRAACLRECARVLRPGGKFIFSSHNARYFLYLPVIDGWNPVRAAWRVIYAVTQTGRNLFHRLPSRAYWERQGYVIDPGLPGGSLRMRVSSPGSVRRELEEVGLLLVETASAPRPGRTTVPAVPWYYYVAAK